MILNNVTDYLRTQVFIEKNRLKLSLIFSAFIQLLFVIFFQYTRTREGYLMRVGGDAFKFIDRTIKLESNIELIEEAEDVEVVEKKEETEEKVFDKSRYAPAYKVQIIPRYISSPDIPYPEFAAEAEIEGKVQLKLFVNENGKVDYVEVVESLGYGCDEVAIEKFRNATFTPGLVDGNPVSTWVFISVPFVLK